MTLRWLLDRHIYRRTRSEGEVTLPDPESDMITRERDEGFLADLLETRVVRLEGYIGDDATRLIIAQIILLESEDRAAPIVLEIDSSGGSVAGALAIIDTMDHVTPPVHTFCRGEAYGMAAMILASGARGERRVLEVGRIGLLPATPAISPEMTEVDQETLEREVERVHGELLAILMEKTGQSEEVLRRGFREVWHLTPEQARGYGVIDEVVELLGGSPS